MVERMRGNPAIAVAHFADACEIVAGLPDVCVLDNCAAALAEAAAAAGREDEAADAVARTLATAPERRSASATRSCSTKPRSPPHEPATSSARPCSPARR